MLVLSFLSLFGCRSQQPPKSDLPEGDRIVYFTLSKGGGMRRFSGYKYKVQETKDGQVHFLFNHEYPDEKEFYVDDHSVFDTLGAIVRKYRMDRYRSRYEPRMEILDGYSWNLYVKYASGKTISSGGYMAGPDNWSQAREELLNCLNSWKNKPGLANELEFLKYSYGSTNYDFRRKGDHAVVTVVDETKGLHEWVEKPLDIMEELRVMAVTEGLRVDGKLESDDPESIPFKFELAFSNGEHYAYESYDLKYKCHYTEVFFWFLKQWEIDPSDFKNDTITYFSLSEGGGMNRFEGFGYVVETTKDNKVHFLFDERFPDEKELTVDDRSVFDSLQEIVMRYKMYNYESDYRPPVDVMDGTSWSLYVVFASGKSISSGGYMAGPEGYGGAFSEIIRCLNHWKEMPSAVNEVVSFRYEYGPERYTMERKKDHATLTYDNVETKEHKTFKRELDMLDDLRKVFNVEGLKENSKRRELEPGCIPWMYEITYSNGTQYRYESYDRNFQSGGCVILHGFLSNWMLEKENRIRFDYY